ncbi:MAG: NAD(P)H-dependent oxidoreductase [Loktanella sp.]|nr:NAD(P)H-dependent oxidoreductase [Loktanella sp.]
MEFLIFLGSARDSTPPRPARLGQRVSRMCHRLLADRAHDAQIIDPLDHDIGGIFKPHFAYAADRAPQALDDLAKAISAADGYVMVSPEYNHSMSPALAHLLNHLSQRNAP